ncbi:variable surface lipoprotein [[Mycoplasma] gypis]|uniref:Variable surface lipoprotein n=1 Tax=[Mycoplasma] gypis TaxID=92404 RepID=A0ABZ2RPV9_9BACT|nr:variable surface lipoprotein [[Mycoplasma] gypis]MBN0919582.1 variable surface lipoprotein [[Mycoplasma] gypis]
MKKFLLGLSVLSTTVATVPFIAAACDNDNKEAKKDLDVFSDSFNASATVNSKNTAEEYLESINEESDFGLPESKDNIEFTLLSIEKHPESNSAIIHYKLSIRLDNKKVVEKEYSKTIKGFKKGYWNVLQLTNPEMIVKYMGSRGWWPIFKDADNNNIYVKATVKKENIVENVLQLKENALAENQVLANPDTPLNEDGTVNNQLKYQVKGDLLVVSYKVVENNQAIDKVFTTEVEVPGLYQSIVSNYSLRSSVYAKSILDTDDSFLSARFHPRRDSTRLAAKFVEPRQELILTSEQQTMLYKFRALKEEAIKKLYSPDTQPIPGEGRKRIRASLLSGSMTQWIFASRLMATLDYFTYNGILTQESYDWLYSFNDSENTLTGVPSKKPASFERSFEAVKAITNANA